MLSVRTKGKFLVVKIIGEGTDEQRRQGRRATRRQARELRQDQRATGLAPLRRRVRTAHGVARAQAGS